MDLLRALILALSVCFLALCVGSEASVTRHYKFDVVYKNVTRLCSTKTIATVNGKFPGPKIVAREGDRVVIRVVNHIKNNVSFHWHGIRQLRNGWADGPAYITQCPIQPNQSYVYNFTIEGQRGTLVWHAHISWMRATLYGPLIVLPKKGVPYPFPKPYKEITSILFGEWFKGDTEAIIAQALQTGAGPNVSDAFTINGLPGFSYNCSKKDTYKLKVKPGKTYMLRMVNVALNDDLFFSIANHTLTVVEADAIYAKPFNTNIILLSPGQTINVLLRTNPTLPNATFLMEARPYGTANPGTFDNTTTVGILEYERSNNATASLKSLQVMKPSLPPINATGFVANYSNTFRSLATPQFPANVPQNVDQQLLFTVGLGTSPCPANQTCQGPNGTKFAASVNNVSFALPPVAILEAHYNNMNNKGTNGSVYTTDFPKFPPFPFNYTGTPPNNTFVTNGTKVLVLPFNTSVELIMQGTTLVNAERHPMHLHGYNFFVVGRGFGNFNPMTDPAKFNLVDPMERNTVGVPSGGWVAIRFLADNPGVWFLHCHLEVHMTWGLRTAFLVMDGPLPTQKMLPPPPDLPKC